MLVCPRCDQGSIKRARAVQIDERIFICDECDAMWHNEADIGSRPWIDFGTYMEARGLPATWNQLAIMGDADEAEMPGAEAPHPIDNVSRDCWLGQCPLGHEMRATSLKS